MGTAIAIVVMLAACPSSITDPSYVLTLSPQTAELFVDDTRQFKATLVDDAGKPVTATFSWSIDNPAVAQIDATGLVRAVGAGTATVEVTARGQVATAALAVAVDSGQHIAVTPSGASLFVDGTQRFRATVTDRHGDTLSASPQWESENAGVAHVDATGLVTGISAGTTTIRARARGLVGTGQVSVSPRPSSAVLVGAGDIASCEYSSDEATAKLLDVIPGTVFTVGDNAYESGSLEEFENCYAPAWGRHKTRTRPAPGNHEYFTGGASGYFGYFGSAAGDSDKGYYSFDLGAWHIVVLNSSLAAGPGSPMETWLRGDLEDHPARCTLAIWHHARFSSGADHGDNPGMQHLWQVLYDYNAEVVVSAHNHTYERFAPQTPNGQFDLTKGIREFVVGTGGARLDAFDPITPNSEVRNNSSHGVLKLTLYDERYDWKFIPVAGGTFTDAGGASCH